MDKKTKIILISVISVFVLILASLLTLLFVLPNNIDKKPEETKTEEVVLYDIPVNKKEIIDFKGKRKSITLSAKPIENDAFLEETIIFIYEDGYISKNDVYSADKILHSSYKIETDKINEFKTLISKLNGKESINDICETGNLYTITDNESGVSYYSCDSCASEIYHCFMDIKCSIERGD